MEEAKAQVMVAQGEEAKLNGAQAVEEELAAEVGDHAATGRAAQAMPASTCQPWPWRPSTAGPLGSPNAWLQVEAVTLSASQKKKAKKKAAAAKKAAAEEGGASEEAQQENQPENGEDDDGDEEEDGGAEGGTEGAAKKKKKRCEEQG